MSDVALSPNLIAAGQVASQSKADNSRQYIEAMARKGQGIDSEKAMQAAQEFESVFLGVLLAPMFNGESTQNSLSGSHAEDTYCLLYTSDAADD